MTTKRYRDLEPGDRFHSPRSEEGIVTVLCAPGRCEHDRSRDEYGCHVSGPEGIRQQFFVNYIPDEDVTLAAPQSAARLAEDLWRSLGLS